MSEQVFDENFPPKALVWPGSMLASIAHAVFVARAPVMAHAQSWDGQSYNMQDSEGSRGVIAFGKDKRFFVALFYREGNPVKRGRDENYAASVLRVVPAQLEKLALEAMQYILNDIGGKAVPVATAAFWSDPGGPRVAAAEPWQDVLEYGAFLAKNQVLPTDLGLRRWVLEFELSPAETDLTEALFKRRCASTEPVWLTTDETERLQATADGAAGFQACRESLAEIGLLLP
jgi:hypothetical protein